MSEKIRISASKIDTFETCSWVYYCKYVLKLPDPSNDGAKRGTVAHLILEVLINPRHRKHYDLIVEKNTIEASPAVYRLVTKACKREKLLMIDNIEIINSTILVGLKYEFFGHENLAIVDNVKVEGDFAIDISESVTMTGIIDKVVTFIDAKISVKDYKGSKKRFDADKIGYNVQALMYSLAVYKKTGIIPDVEFIFLRFPKKCSQKTTKCTVDELLGFEDYLLFLAEQMQNFTIENAHENLAVNNEKNRWKCGRETGWCCPFRKPREYYSIKDKNGETRKIVLELEDADLKEGERLFRLGYKGCPAFNQSIEPEKKELLDF